MRFLVQVKKRPDPHWQTLTMTDTEGEALAYEGVAMAHQDIVSTRVIPLGRVPEPTPRIPNSWAMPQIAL